MKSNEIDMTTGSLPKKILMYSVPLMLSNVLQVMFNLCDVAVVGKFVGPLALGAVGSTSIIITLTTGILLGLAGGVNAVVALFVGAKNSANVKKAVHTSIVICMIAGLLLLLSGLFLSRPVLNLIGTKKELIDGAVIYLTIYLLGSPALAMYNYGNAVLSAVGDTKRPLMYLITAGIINVVLNLFFVIVCRLGVVGVALASIISQYISAFLILKFQFIYSILYKPCIFKAYRLLNVQTLCIFPCFCPYEPKQGKFLFSADYLIQQSCGSTLRFPCSVSVNVHCGTDISVSEKFLHIFRCCTV